jgi:hypothetical protein
MPPRSVPLALLLAPLPASAGIISATGNAVHDTTTDLSTIDFDVNVYESSDVVGFDEAQDVYVAADTVCVDDQLIDTDDVDQKFHGAPDDGSSTCVYLEPGWYSSQILHYDVAGRGTPVQHAIFEFDGDVVGFAWGTVGLLSTDDAFGTAASYPDPLVRCVDAADTWTLSASDEVTVNYFWHDPNWYDELRVITRAADGDDDTVIDSQDSCAGTDPGTAVLADGCSVEQTCPSTATWRYHTAYVGCVIDAADQLFDDGSITARQRNMLVGAAARSDIGR